MTTIDQFVREKFAPLFTYPDPDLFVNRLRAAQGKAVAETAEELRKMAFAEAARIANDFATANENMGGPESFTAAARAIEQLILDKVAAP